MENEHFLSVVKVPQGPKTPKGPQSPKGPRPPDKVEKGPIKPP